MKSYRHEVSEEQKKQALESQSRKDADRSAARNDVDVAGAPAYTLDSLSSDRSSLAKSSLLRLQRYCGNQCVLRVLNLARKAEDTGELAPDVERTIETARGGGQPLDSGASGQMGDAFNADFSGVRVHTDSGADSLNQSLSAKAFTTGQDVFFRQGEYNPGSSSGRELLAHELTHVVQQNGDKIQGKYKDEEAPSFGSSGARKLQAKFTLGQPGDIYEQEADRMAQSYSRWENRGAGATESAGNLHRQTDEEEKEKPVMTKRSGGLVQCQPEMASEEKKEEEGLQTKLKTEGLQKQSAEDEELKD
jgi:uncharacterized protein DUF4157